MMRRDQRSAGQGEPDAEDDEPLELMFGSVTPTAYPEGEEAVGRGVEHRGDEQGKEVGRLVTGQAVQRQEQHGIGQCACHTDDSEPHQLADHARGHTLDEGLTAETVPQLLQRQRAEHERPAQPPDAEQVFAHGVDDVHPAVRVIHPVDRHLVDAQTDPLGEHQQLSVEEPLLVLDQRQQLARDIGTDRLEAALSVGEPDL
ncbi:Uncharacterised protein [Mycobacteroides abscessus subsp. massiliense]|nr:Uncharacterised protein [Mycobacteroides abscessus subsp. massiliense]SLJ18054.1 Uncharacterised protein [Mycobacteroides abscessus subsp. massiliense]